MILISGTQLTNVQLPFSEIMNYTIEPNEQFLKIKLRTIAKNPVCLGVYLHKDLKGKFDIEPEVEEKLHFFTSDTQLCKLLETGGAVGNEEAPEEEEKEEEQPTAIAFGDNTEEVETQPEAFTTPKVEEKVSTDTTFTLIDTIDIESDPTDIVFEIPIEVEDTNVYKQRLESKDRIIEQKDSQLQEMKKSLDELYKLQDIQLAEIKSVYEQRIDEANLALADAKKKIENLAVPEELHGYFKAASYAQNHKASLREGYSQEDIKRMGKISSSIHIYASGGGESLHTFMKSVNDLIENRANVLIVDFSNDQYLISKHRIKTRDTSILLRDDFIAVKDLVKSVNGVPIIPTGFFNDIALLTFDWIDVIKRLNQIAQGRPILFIFNSINSFAVRYTVSKLGTLGEASIFAKSNPLVLTSLFADIAFIPENRFKVVALDYIDIVNPILKHMSNTKKVVAFKEGVEWEKIGLKV